MTESLDQDRLRYQAPAPDMVSLLEASSTPSVSLNRSFTWMLTAHMDALVSIEDLAQPELRLAGLRINPRNHAPSRSTHTHAISLQHLQSGESFEVSGLPQPLKLTFLSWSPDGRHIAFAQYAADHLEAWVIEVATKTARRLWEGALNAATGSKPFVWQPNSQGLLVRTVPQGHGSPPERPLVPSGPVVSENNGEIAPVRTFQDLLQDPYDEAVFEYHTTVQWLRVGLDGSVVPVGKPDLYLSVSHSPDGSYLLVDRLKKPFSYLVTYNRFPREIEVWTAQGQFIRSIASVQNGETIPKGFMATREGPRNVEWRSDQAAMLYWVEAQDGGDPAREVPVRDKMFHLAAPFQGDPVFDLDFALRAADVTWGDDHLALIQEYWWNNRRVVTSRFQPGANQPNDTKVILFDRSWEDRYNDPGSFETQYNAYGRQVLLTDASREYLFLSGAGASEDGNRPFVDRYQLADGQTERLWRCEGPVYEYPIQIIDPEGPLLLTRRESNDSPPNYFFRHLETGHLQNITAFPHPYPQLRGVEKQVIRYQREDGVGLNGNLYLPPGYDPEVHGPIPLLMWAYPEEFKSADAAGQVQGSPHQFLRIGWYSPLFWLLKGYAILDDPGMPIVGEGESEPNDRFVPQLVGNARAAIDFLVGRGIADPARVAVGGHSYGAFMTANLLAHTELFACGIARSGAYNRTLTPFGFQSEERTYWEAPEVYRVMSPFAHADKIKAPILLIHGAADNNAGTYPMQSERFYHALKGHGAKARLVMLPHESHGYAARESILHMLWEMTTFLEKHLGTGHLTESKEREATISRSS